MSNIHLTSIARLPRSRASGASAPASVPASVPAFPWAGEMAFCGAFLAVLALAWLA